jgi:glycosyltransferase involved in cell wall biosynthesis
MEKIAIIITTCNRTNYLKQCLDSLSKTFIPEYVSLIFIDDCSDENNVELIERFEKETGKHITIQKNKERKGIKHNLFAAYSYAFYKLNADFVIVLNDDCIVNNYFYDTMAYFHDLFPNDIISGFNTLTLSELGTPRHPIAKDCGFYIEKESAGGLCYGITKEIYEEYTAPSLNWTHPNYDTAFTKAASEDGVKIICPVPSVAEHIGFESSMGHSVNPDVSADFRQYIEL